jgi:ethanolaminephosphotransferase
MNFGHDEMVTDTFLSQLHQRRDRIVFTGDDTWRIFKMIFQRAYFNRDSLFVNDFYEGDRNVTNSLRHELKRDDWKLLILRRISINFFLSLVPT